MRVFNNYGSAFIFLVNHLKSEKKKNVRFSHARLSYPSVLSEEQELKNPPLNFVSHKIEKWSSRN